MLDGLEIFFDLLTFDYCLIMLLEQELDHAFDRALGLRISNDLKHYLTMVTADTVEGAEADKGIMLRALPKIQARRMWKKNMYNSKKTTMRTNANVGWNKKRVEDSGHPNDSAEIEEGEVVP